MDASLPDLVRLKQQARELADTWRLKGGVRPAAAAICSGPADDSLQAAKALGDLVRDSGAAEALEEGYVVTALLQIFDFKTLEDVDQSALQFSLQVIVEASSDAAAQLVAAYADPDPWVAFAAIPESFNLLKSVSSRANLLQGGAAKALVAALNHDSPDCRGASAFATFAAAHSEVLTALRAAGLIPAMMDLVRRGFAPSPSPPPSQSRPGLGLLRGSKALRQGSYGKDFEIPLADAALIACSALNYLCKSHAQLAQEIAETADPATAILSCLRQSVAAGEAATVPAELLATLVAKLKGPCKLAICIELSAGEFPALLPSLIRPEFPILTESAIFTFICVLSCKGMVRECISLENAERTLEALVQFLDSDSASAGNVAELAFFLLYQISDEVWSRTLVLESRCLSDNVFKHAARCLCYTCAVGGALGPLHVLLTLMNQENSDMGAEVLGRPAASGAAGRAKALALAVSEGFIPGVLRLISFVRLSLSSPGSGKDGDASRTYRSARSNTFECTEPKHDPALSTDTYEVTVHVRELLWLAVEQHVAKLVTEVKVWIQGGDLEQQRSVLQVLPDLCDVPQAFAKMQEGIFSTHLLDLVDSPHPEVLVALLLVLLTQLCGTNAVAVLLQLMAAGFVTKLEQAWDQRFQQDTEHGDTLKELIVELKNAAKLLALVYEQCKNQTLDMQQCTCSQEGRHPLQHMDTPVDAPCAAPSDTSQSLETRYSEDQGASAGREDASLNPPKGKKPKRRCSQCGKSRQDGVELLVCKDCKVAWYCGQACQKGRWKTHLLECKSLRSDSPDLDTPADAPCAAPSDTSQSLATPYNEEEGAGGVREHASHNPPKDKEQEQRCSQCGKSGQDGVELRVCKRCKVALYCGMACHRNHWKTHELERKSFRSDSPDLDTLEDEPCAAPSDTSQSLATRYSKEDAVGAGREHESHKPQKGKKQKQRCSRCGKSRQDGVKLQACGGCKVARYCGQACQKSHWKTHQLECKSLRRRSDGRPETPD